ncbi:MAG: helix-turn-helix transcriptional regulator [Verrucomicrobiota bacterium]
MAKRDHLGEIFGRNVSKTRSQIGLTQALLAEKTGISTRYLQKIESGEKIPSLPTLLKIQQVLKVDWNDLFKGL